MQKKKPADIQRVPLLKLTSLERVSNLDLEVKENSQTIEIKKDDTTWELRSLEQKTILDKLASNTIPLGQFVTDQIFYGLKTGFNEAFIVDNDTKEKICKVEAKGVEVFKPLLIGKEISPYLTKWEGLWVIVIPSGWTNKHRDGIDPEIFIQQPK